MTTPHQSFCLADFRCMRLGKQGFMAEEGLLAPVNIRREKKERAILLLHGFGSSPAVFRLLLPFCSNYDAVIVPCLPGHATNLADFASTRLDTIVDYVEALSTTLLQEFEKLDVLGLSMGGAVACHLSARLNFNHLYLLAPALDLQLTIPRMLLLMKGLSRLGFRNLRNRAGSLHIEDQCEIAYRLLPLSIAIELLGFIQKTPFSLPSCKTDLFLGSYDKVVDGKKVAARFAHHKEMNLHWLKHSAHVLPLDGDFQVIGERIKSVSG